MSRRFGRLAANTIARGRVQLLALVAANSKFIPGLDALKCCTYPFLNCYSCPLAIGACPIGSLQYFVIIRQVPLFVIGAIGAVGAIWGRMACGWLCPFGFVQDLLHRLPWPRRKWQVRTGRYGWVKYVVLVLLALVIPFITLEPWFCKLCPAGTIEAALPWLALSPPLRELIGPDFWVKIAIVVAFVWFSAALSRPFCRFACPLGAAYGLANRWSRVRIEVAHDQCTSCGKCEAVCPMGVEPHVTPNSSDCIRCKRCTTVCAHLKLTSPPLVPKVREREEPAPSFRS